MSKQLLSAIVSISILITPVIAVASSSSSSSTGSSTNNSSRTNARPADKSRAQRKATSTSSRFDVKKIESVQSKNSSLLEKRKEVAKKNWGKSSSKIYIPVSSKSSSSKSSLSTKLPIDPEITLSIINFLAPTDVNIESMKETADFYNDASHQGMHSEMIGFIFRVKESAAKLAYYQKQSEARGLNSDELKEVEKLKDTINASINKFNDLF